MMRETVLAEFMREKHEVRAHLHALMTIGLGEPGDLLSDFVLDNIVEVPPSGSDGDMPLLPMPLSDDDIEKYKEQLFTAVYEGMLWLNSEERDQYRTFLRDVRAQLGNIFKNFMQLGDQAMDDRTQLGDVSNGQHILAELYGRLTKTRQAYVELDRRWQEVNQRCEEFTREAVVETYDDDKKIVKYKIDKETLSAEFLTNSGSYTAKWSPFQVQELEKKRAMVAGERWRGADDKRDIINNGIVNTIVLDVNKAMAAEYGDIMAKVFNLELCDPSDRTNAWLYSVAQNLTAHNLAVNETALLYMRAVIYKFLIFFTVKGQQKVAFNWEHIATIRIADWKQIFYLAHKEDEMQSLLLLYNELYTRQLRQWLVMQQDKEENVEKDIEWLFAQEKETAWQIFYKELASQQTNIFPYTGWLLREQYSEFDNMQNIVQATFQTMLRTRRVPNILNAVLASLEPTLSNHLDFKLRYELYSKDKENEEIKSLVKELHWKPVPVVWRETTSDAVQRQTGYQMSKLSKKLHKGALLDTYAKKLVSHQLSTQQLHGMHDNIVMMFMREFLMQEAYVSSLNGDTGINLKDWMIFEGDESVRDTSREMVRLLCRVAEHDYRTTTSAHIPKCLTDYCAAVKTHVFEIGDRNIVQETKLEEQDMRDDAHDKIKFAYEMPVSIEVSDDDTKEKYTFPIMSYQQNKDNVTRHDDAGYPYTHMWWHEYIYEFYKDQRDGQLINLVRSDAGNVRSMIMLCDAIYNTAEEMPPAVHKHIIHDIIEHELCKNKTAVYASFDEGHHLFLTPMLVMLTNLMCYEEIARLSVVISRLHNLNQRAKKRACSIAFHTEALKREKRQHQQEKDDINVWQPQGLRKIVQISRWYALHNFIVKFTAKAR